jgi:hypothetical protein
MQFHFDSFADRDPKALLKQFNQRRETLLRKAHGLHKLSNVKVAIYISDDVKNWIYKSHQNFPAGVELVRYLVVPIRIAVLII